MDNLEYLKEVEKSIQKKYQRQQKNIPTESKNRLPDYL